MPNTVIACGSGPSIYFKEALHEQGFPVAAISTAIRYVPNPNYWIFVDRMNKEHQKGAQKWDIGPGGDAAAKDPNVMKVVPTGRLRFMRGFPNVKNAQKNGNEYLDPNTGLECVSVGLNRSSIFAVEWLMKVGGFDRVIFTGFDLVVPAKKSLPKNRTRRLSNIQREIHEWRRLWPLARAKGKQWLSWDAKSPMRDFIDEYIPVCGPGGGGEDPDAAPGAGPAEQREAGGPGAVDP